jgi:2-haloalkanoic acid dehalogenase type II
MRYKAVLLDFYGTLVEEDDPLLDSIVRQVAAHSRRDNDTAEILREWWVLMSAMVREARGTRFRPQRDLEVESLRQLLCDWRADLDAVALCQDVFRYWEAPRAYVGAAEFVGRLPVPACIVSNIDSADLDSALAHLGWRAPLAVTSEGCRSYKPNPEPFEAALEMLRLAPGEVLHVGDSLTSDVGGAQRLGIDVAWMNRRGRRLPDVPPTHMARGFDDVLRFFLG